MIPSITAVRMTGGAHRGGLPLLVLGPSLGTSAMSLWSGCARELSDHFDVLAWDLPGHGYNTGVPDESFTMAELAAGVLAVVDDVLAERGELEGTFAYAGNSVGGVVGLQLLIDVPRRVTSAVLICAGAKIGEPELWRGRIEQVGVSGTQVMVAGSTERWFAPGFLDRAPEIGAAILGALADADDAGYSQVCAALADFDVRDRLGEIRAPVLAVAAEHDAVTPTALLNEIASGVRSGRVVVLPGVSHLAPAAAPTEVAALIRQHVLGEAKRAPASPHARTRVCADVAEAVAGIEDGATVLVGGFGMAGMPVALIDALIGQGATGLTVVSNNAGNGDTGLAALLAKGRVSKMICSYPRQHDSWVFDRLYRAGEVELELVPQGNLAERLRAAGAGIGAFYCATGVGTPFAAGKESREIDGRTYVLEYPIKGDVALIGAHRADRVGNLVYRKTGRNFGPVMATAADLVIAQVREVVDAGGIDPESVVTPGIFVDRVVQV